MKNKFEIGDNAVFAILIITTAVITIVGIIFGK
jgi:hypothetical protein